MNRLADSEGQDLRGEDLKLDLSGREILAGIDIAVEAGTSLVLTGPSGAGKTVLLLVLAGRIAPTQGRVLIGGRPIEAISGGYKMDIGLILDRGCLVGGLTAAETVALPLQARGLPRREIGDLVERSLSAVGLALAADRMVDGLSGGQRQRVGVARALVGSPSVLIADEPVAELDPESRDRVLALILDRRRTAVLASNDPTVAAACDRVLELRDGTVGWVPEHKGFPH